MAVAMFNIRASFNTSVLVSTSTWKAKCKSSQTASMRPTFEAHLIVPSFMILQGCL